jgi:methyl coenzyme M reductase beta subunit
MMLPLFQSALFAMLISMEARALPCGTRMLKVKETQTSLSQILAKIHSCSEPL